MGAADAGLGRLPIYFWLVAHAEGLIAVDTEETARVSEPGDFPQSASRRGVRRSPARIRASKMIELSTGVRIGRGLAEVFDYVSEPENFPRWNSAVRSVRRTSGVESGVGTRYVMKRDLPTGPVENELEVVGRYEPTEFAIRTTSGPTPFAYRYEFSEAEGGTDVQLYAQVELGGLASKLGPLARRAVKKGVDDNLRTLKRLLESG